MPGLRAFSARKAFVTFVAAGSLSLAFLCWTAPTAAQTVNPIPPELQRLLEGARAQKEAEIRASPIYKKKHNECILKHVDEIAEARTDMAVRVLAQACVDQAEIYYMEQEGR